MWRKMSVWIVASMLLASLGCNTEGPTGHGVAVIDLDAIARRLGREMQMQQAVREKEAILNDELASLQSFYQRDYAEAQQAFGDTPTPDQANILRQKMQRMNSELKKAQTKSQQELNQLSAGLITRFREEVLPVARSVAAESGMNVVVTNNDTVVFAVDPEADITDRVIAKMLAATPAAPPALSPQAAAVRPPAPASQPPSQQPSPSAANVSSRPPSEPVPRR